MRVSVDKQDPGYREDAHSGNYRCLLDGEEINAVITADEEKGYILKYKLENGDHVLEEDDKTGVRYLVTEELTGDVKIIKTADENTN